MNDSFWSVLTAVPPHLHAFLQIALPQNGDTPALLDSGNVFTLSVDLPCTQLVTLSATVGGQHLSTSVLFSTIQDKANILSARAPLPTDAAWGPRLEEVPCRPRELEGDSDIMIKGEKGTGSGQKHGKQRMVGRRGLHAPQRVENGVGKAPISLVFVGSLRLDGQKHIWLQQMEHLARARFISTYLTFEGGEGGSTNNADTNGGASTWKTNAVEIFTQRLRRAGVPLVQVRLPQVDESWIFDSSSVREASVNLQEMAFKAVLESIDRAGGKPRSMSPPWARELFKRIADAVEGVSPDVLVVANGKTLGDVVLTKAARWAMRDHDCKIVMDFPNIEPAQGVDVDALTTPSHYVARHPDTEELATATGARVVVIPPGVQAASSILLSAKGITDNAGVPPDRQPGALVSELFCDSGVLMKLGCCDPDCHVRFIIHSFKCIFIRYLVHVF